MPYPKSDMRAGAERAVEGARAGLLALLASPALADEGARLADAVRTSDHAVAMAEVKRLVPDHPEVGEAWKAFDEAIKFLAFSLLTDMADGTE